MEESNLDQNPPTIPNQQPVQPVENQAQVSKPASKSKLPLMLIVVFALLIILGSGAYLLKSSNLKNQISNPQLKSQNLTPTQITITSPSPTIDETASPDPTANWKTYKNDKYSYNIKYPKELEVGPEGYFENTETADGISIQQKLEGYNKPLLKIYTFKAGTLKNNFTFNSLEELVNLSFKENIGNKNTLIKVIQEPTKSIFLGESAYEYKIESKGFSGAWTGFLGEQGIIKIIVFKHNDNYYFIGYYENSLFDQIFSTFRFAN